MVCPRSIPLFPQPEGIPSRHNMSVLYLLCTFPVPTHRTCIEHRAALYRGCCRECVKKGRVGEQPTGSLGWGMEGRCVLCHELSLQMHSSGVQSYAKGSSSVTPATLYLFCLHELKIFRCTRGQCDSCLLGPNNLEVGADLVNDKQAIA